MGLSFRQQDGRIVPVLTCDTCNGAIEDWHRAVVTSIRPEAIPLPVRIFHMGACDQAAVGQPFRQVSGGWMSLAHYLPWLLWTHGWGEKVEASDGQPARLIIDVPGPMDL